VASGSLPPGLTLTSDGVLSGKNTTSGTFSFTIKVADAAGGEVSQKGSVTVYSGLSSTQPCVGKCVRGKGCTTCGVFGTVSRGLAPYTYKIVGGSVPSGMKWNGALALTGGFPAGSWSLSVLITDKLGATETVSANWSIYSPPKLNAGSDCTNAGSGGPCSTAGWSYSGGNPSIAPKVVIVGYSQYCGAVGCYPTPTAPPPQWSVTFSGSAITFSVGGIACNTAEYAGYVILKLVDTSKCATTSPSNQASLLVNQWNGC